MSNSNGSSEEDIIQVVQDNQEASAIRFDGIGGERRRFGKQFESLPRLKVSPKSSPKRRGKNISVGGCRDEVFRKVRPSIFLG